MQDESNDLLPSRGSFNQPGIYVDLSFPRQKGFYHQGDNGLGEYSYQAHVTCQHLLWLEFQKEQIVSLEARRVAFWGEILGKRCNSSNAPQKDRPFEHCCHVSYQLDTDSFLCLVLAALSCAEGVRGSASPSGLSSLRTFPQMVLQRGEIIQVAIN